MVHVFCLLRLCRFWFRRHKQKLWNKISPLQLANSQSKEKDATPPYTGERSKSVSSLKFPQKVSLIVEREQAPPIPPLPLNYQRSDGELRSSLVRRVESEQKNIFNLQMKAASRPTSQEMNWRNFVQCRRHRNKLNWNGRHIWLTFLSISHERPSRRLRIAQEIKREQDEIDLKIKDLETRGVELEKMLRGEGQNIEQLNESSLSSIGSSDEDLLKELLDIWRNITQYKKRDEELIIRQQELQLEHRHAQLKEELSVRLSCSSELIEKSFESEKF